VRKLLLHLDTSTLPSVFDRIVALDAGADEVMSYGGVTPETVRDLVHGAIFTRGPKDLHQTAIFIGGSDMAAGERLLEAIRKAFFGPLRVSVMLDSNGSNTTAVAAVLKLQQASGPAGNVQGRRIVVAPGTGPVGMRAAGLLAKAGADVTITSRDPEKGAQVVRTIQGRFSGHVRSIAMAGSGQAAEMLEGAEMLLNAGPAGVRLFPRSVWEGRKGLRVVADLNAVPPTGIEGVEPNDDFAERDGVVAFGALGVGNLKMKIHKACVARLFERNDLTLDAEAIADLGRALAPPRT
jgi:NADPH-dependent 2,4-dienoyl-CoA reductase/sulfur reductase-like enzyme